jgi:hypothetical protein
MQIKARASIGNLWRGKHVNESPMAPCPETEMDLGASRYNKSRPLAGGVSYSPAKQRGAGERPALKFQVRIRDLSYHWGEGNQYRAATGAARGAGAKR